MPTLTKVKHVIKPTSVACDEAAAVELAHNPESLAKLGLSFHQNYLATYSAPEGVALDAGITQPVTTPSNGTPLQFLQAQIPGIINVLQVVRKADQIAPVVTAGEWHFEEVYLKTMEHTGSPQLYSDHGGIPYASFNETYETRQVVRHELGLQVTKLSEARSGATSTNEAAEKRAAVAMAFEILRNNIAFNGFNIGTGKTYGVLNDPLLPAYVTVAAGASTDTEWSTKTAAEKVSDIVTGLAALNTQAGGNIDITSTPIDLEIALSVQPELYRSDTSFTNGMTVKEWLNKNFPNINIVTVPQFDSANGGDSVFYLKAQSVPGAGDALGGNTMAQVVPVKMMALGAVPSVKGMEEGFTSANAGVFTALPFAVVRYSGI